MATAPFVLDCVCADGNMIITKLIGGLGNQMFQYAAARQLAEMHHQPLKLDVTGFQGYALRKYELNHLGIHAEIATDSELSAFKGCNYVTAYLRRSFGRSWPYRNRVIRERFFQYDPAIAKFGGNIYLEGYWQSEKYFQRIKDIIRQEFMVCHEPDSRNKALAAEIAEVNAVSLHVRRGDYVTDTVTSLYHGTCTLEYYRRAVARIAANVTEPHFFVFSDDSEWAQKNLRLDFPSTFVTHNGAEKSYEDLRLMTLCKHHITANSSFSWWGAWLNNSAGKIVIAPDKWFNRKELDTSDLLPSEWLRL
jgi:hypothetical protein